MEFQTLFTESKGQPIIYKGKEIKMIDKVILNESTSKMKVTFLSTDSSWKQGIIFQTAGYFEGNEKRISKKIVLWEHTAPKEIELLIKSKDKRLIIYNVWETEDGTTDYWHNGAAMYIEEKETERIYNCNDGAFDEDFNDLIFKTEVLS